MVYVLNCGNFIIYTLRNYFLKVNVIWIDEIVLGPF